MHGWELPGCPHPKNMQNFNIAVYDQDNFKGNFNQCETRVCDKNVLAQSHKKTS